MGKVSHSPLFVLPVDTQNITDCVYEVEGGMMDYSSVAVSQEEESMFQGGGGQKRQHNSEVDQRKRKRFREATP